jgi:hypothetical protein
VETTANPAARAGRRPLSRSKRILFSAATFLGTYLIVECISYAAIHLWYCGWSAVQTAKEGAAGPDVLNTGFDYVAEVLHPYLGWVRRPSGAGAPESGLPTNQFGFADFEVPLHLRSRDKVIIGILGGSVAEQFAAEGTGILRDEMQKSEACRGKEIVFVRLALSGYKQPQQLLAVNYLLALGAQFDILINIDGYNEIVLPAVENTPNHVFDAYPRSWHVRVSKAGDSETMALIGKIAFLKDQLKSSAKAAQTPPFCYSPTVNLAWRSYHENGKRSLYATFASVNELKIQGGNYAASGPAQSFSDSAAACEHAAQLWRSSSLQLHRQSVANDIRYYHFLQPNQYVPGSKTMGGEEMMDAWNPVHPGKEPVEKGYPFLIREGGHLLEQGVAFIDLTMLFVDRPEQIYKDRCCHVNRHGNELLARKIAEVVMRQ